MKKYTPGPWIVEVYHDYTNVEAKAWTVASHVSNDDAHLIAAAPEMLEALKAVFQKRAPGFNFDFSNAPDMQLVIAAIKRAEGK